MKKSRLINVLVSILFLYSCTSVKPTGATGSNDNGRIRVNFVQVNDVYEIAPLAGGAEGGMARVATIKQKYQEKNPNTFLLMAGDFLSPSVYNSLKYEGKTIRGKQMVEVMNAAGMDFAIFGNHEFDIREAELQERINESRFQWIASNSFHLVKNKAEPFAKISASGTQPFPTYLIKTIKDEDGTIARLGFIGIMLPFNKAAYVSYKDALTTAKEIYNSIKDSVDAVIAITHQTIEEDRQLAREIPGLAMILGGHEHDQHIEKIGNVSISKSMANAKTVFVTKLNINTRKHSFKTRTKLEVIDDSIIADTTTDAVVRRWVTIAENNYATLGFDAKKTVFNAGAPLDGREIAVRSQVTNLTRLIVSAMAYAAPKADVVILNAGSIRVDDIMPMPVSQYDIIRSLPYGGSIREADMKGSLLIKILENGAKNKGIGGFLHYNEAVIFNTVSNKWELKSMPINPQATYRVALTDFLLTGGESNLEFLKDSNPEIVKLYPVETDGKDPRSDIRKAVIQFAAKM